MNVNEIASLGSNVKPVIQNENCSVLMLNDATGEGVMTVYRVMPGVMICFSDMHMEQCASEFELKNNSKIFCIDHCREGRIEMEVKPGVFSIMQEKELRLDNRENHKGTTYYPLKHYHGVSIFMEVVEVQKALDDTHPAIIEQEVFDKVQEIRQQRHRRTKTGKSSLFSGMVYCADCGAKMRYCTTNYFEKRQDHFVCANYRSNTESCSAHFIRAVVLEELVWMHMRTVISYVSRYEDHFRAVMEQKLQLSSEAAIRGHKKRLAQAEKRLGELDRLFIRIYEDNVAERITDERFSMMSKTYEDEQAQLKVEIQTLRQEIEGQERQIENLEQFIQRVRKYEDLDELTPYALRELVKAIYIEAPDKSSGKRHQGIRISYDLVGFIPVEELLKQETA